MAVLIEGISVVINDLDLRGEKFQNWEEFLAIVPNQTVVNDGELIRVGFMAPDDARSFIKTLEQYGLTFLENGKAKDIAIVDQLKGITTPCEWAEFGHIELDTGEGMVAACRLKNSKENMLYTPEDWEFKDSLSDKHGFVPAEKKDERLLYLRTDGNVNVYLDAHSGKEVFTGRTDKK